MSAYLLDTNILSEVMRPEPEKKAVQWLDDQYVNDLYISTITVAEIHLGIALLPDGRRKDMLSLAANNAFNEFGGNVLDFTVDAALNYAEIVATRSKMGRPISVEDAQIAAIALANNATLVTRNVNDFALVSGLNIINPFRE